MAYTDPTQMQQTYPFPSTSTGTADSGVNQTFNIQPTASTGMKKGGKVKTKRMARGGGCEVRGKTKGRMV
jgi:tartrate dehydratase alpha subunit/fumarate hydratase class I-like protein